MPLPDLIFTIFLISLFCCGLSVISSPGKVLYFLRQPLDALETQIVTWQQSLLLFINSNQQTLLNIKRAKLLLNVFTPIILCCTCMASFWGIVIFILLHGFAVSMIKYMVICCIGAAFTNAFFISKYNQ